MKGGKKYNSYPKRRVEVKSYLMEFIGTFFLALAIISLSGNALAIGLMFMAMAYLGGGISGGYYNPAVTLAIFLKGKLNMINMIGYMVAQLLGALLAGGLFHVVSGDLFCPKLSPQITAWVTGATVCLEALLTFVFVWAVLETIKKRPQEPGGALILGFTLAAIAYIGGLFNPAVAAGSMVSSLVLAGPGCSMPDLAVYLVAPFLGGIAAVFGSNFFEK